MLLATISMVMLLLFGAFAVDLGAAWSQRRENQAAVDPAGVAGALQTAGLLQGAAIAAADAEVIRITYSSIDPAMTFSQWQAEWAACTDPDKGAEYTVTGSSDCISYNRNLQKLRAKTPLVETQTTFAGVIGIDTVSTDAFVEVILGQDRSGGGVLPFGLPGGAAGDIEICLKTGANPKNVVPCDGPDTGNFGFLDITEYGDVAAEDPTLVSCNGTVNARLSRNIARGVDHPMVEAPLANSPFKRDITGCTSGNWHFNPYSLTTGTGNRTGVLDAGFIEGVSGLPGRLTLSSDRVSQGGKTFDDKPLWEYLNVAGQSLCPGVIDKAGMAACITKIRANPGTVYFWGEGEAGPDIATSPRFAWVPLMHGTTLGNGSTTLNIDEFRPIYVQTTLWSCDANACDATHDPSEPGGIVGTIKQNSKLEAVSAFQIPRSNLPDSVDDGFFGTSGADIFYAITK
jgi:hypothetical protein